MKMKSAGYCQLSNVLALTLIMHGMFRLNFYAKIRQCLAWQCGKKNSLQNTVISLLKNFCEKLISTFDRF